MREFRTTAVAALSAAALFVGQAGMASAAAKGTSATGDGTVTQQPGTTYNFNFSAQTGKGGFTIFNTADRKNLVTAGKTDCIALIAPDTVAIIGTASNKNTDPAFSTSPKVLIVARDSSTLGDAISITGTTETVCSSISPSTSVTRINGIITISGT
jgi:hypothetical protein